MDHQRLLLSRRRAERLGGRRPRRMVSHGRRGRGHRGPGDRLFLRRLDRRRASGPGPGQSPLPDPRPGTRRHRDVLAECGREPAQQSRFRTGRNLYVQALYWDWGDPDLHGVDVGHGRPGGLAQLLRRLGRARSRAVFGGRHGGRVLAGDSGFTRGRIPFLRLVLG